MAPNCTPVEPTLGGGDPFHEHELRTNKIDDFSKGGDWTKVNPWRSTGFASRGTLCGIISGSDIAFPDPPTTAYNVLKAGPGTCSIALNSLLFSSVALISLLAPLIRHTIITRMQFRTRRMISSSDWVHLRKSNRKRRDLSSSVCDKIVLAGMLLFLSFSSEEANACCNCLAPSKDCTRM